MSTIPGLQHGEGYGFDARGHLPYAFWGEGSSNESPDSGVVVSLVEEEGRWTDQSLLAPWICRLEKMGLVPEHEPCCLRPRQHHARAAQDMRLEYLTEPENRKKTPALDRH